MVHIKKKKAKKKKRIRTGQPAVGSFILCSNMGLPQWLSR